MTAQPEILYGADDLTHLEGLDAVRKRPGMYIGSTDSRGVNHLANEIIDNATDEGVGGHAEHVAVILHADGSVQVDDDGRGIPTDINAKSGLNGVELVLTRLHAGASSAAPATRPRAACTASAPRRSTRCRCAST